MASLQIRVENLATRIATELKAVRTLINGNQPSLAALTTTAKDNLVNAINELDADIAALGVAVTINDVATVSTTETYSINKILAVTAALKAEILGGAGAAQDTLAELKAYADSGAAADLVALANRLRVDAAQGLTAPQQLQGQTNLDVWGKADIGNPDTDYVAVFNAGLL